LIIQLNGILSAVLTFRHLILDLFYCLALNQITPIAILKAGNGQLSHKSLAIGTIVILASSITIVSLLAMNSMLQAFNPVAAVTALTVALIGIVWFKRASR
jgi:hypothetical protein